MQSTSSGNTPTLEERVSRLEAKVFCSQTREVKSQHIGDAPRLEALGPGTWIEDGEVTARSQPVTGETMTLFFESGISFNNVLYRAEADEHSVYSLENGDSLLVRKEQITAIILHSPR